ncbi:MAG: hypothetical protein RLZZ117_1650 [Cyanobacteriota bacterium]
MDEEIISFRWMFTALMSEASEFSYGDTFSTNGQTFKVEYQPLPIDDGTWCEIPLSDPIAVEPQPVIILYLTTADGESLTTTEGVLLEAA